MPLKDHLLFIMNILSLYWTLSNIDQYLTGCLGPAWCHQLKGPSKLESIFLSRVEGSMSRVEGTMSRVIFFFNFSIKKMCCCCCLIKIVCGHSNSLKSKEPSPSAVNVDRSCLKKISWSLGRGTRWTTVFSVKYLFGEAKIAYNFLSLEEG